MKSFQASIWDFASLPKKTDALNLFEFFPPRGDFIELWSQKVGGSTIKQNLQVLGLFLSVKKDGAIGKWRSLYFVASKYDFVPVMTLLLSSKDS